MLNLGPKEAVALNPSEERPSFNVLVCEDDQLIAYDLMNALELGGMNALGPAMTFEAAALFAESNALDAAVVDLNLKDGRTGVAVARRLYAQGIALILCSSDVLGPCELDDIHHIFVPKPMAAEALCEFVQQMAVCRGALQAPEKVEAAGQSRRAP